MSENITDAGRWRGFLRALAEEIDLAGGAAGRDALLRGIGRRMALDMPLAAAETIEALELEMNDRLARIGWGAVALRLDAAEAALLISHTGLPALGSAGDPPGSWLAATLEGLYETWLAQLPGADASLAAHRTGCDAGRVTLRYAL